MKGTDKTPNYKELYHVVQNIFKNSEHFYWWPYDETYYTLRVFETAKEIIKRGKLETKCNVPAILVACLFHDTGKCNINPSLVCTNQPLTPEGKREWKKHPQCSGPIARKHLSEMGYSNEFVNEVVHLVTSHDDWEEKKQNNQKSLELQVLQDADLLGDIGMASFIRVLIFAPKFKLSIIESIRHLQKKPARFKKEDYLSLNISKKIAEEKIAFQHQLIKEIGDDIKSELLD